MALTFIDEYKIKRAESSLEEAVEDLHRSKNHLLDESIDQKLEDIASKRAILFDKRQQFTKKHPGTPIPGRTDISLPSYVISNSEVERPDGTDLSYLRKTTPGKLTSSTQDTSGQTRPDRFNQKIAKATQTVFDRHLKDRLKRDPSTGKVVFDPKTKEPLIQKGIINSLCDGEIISSDLRKGMHNSVNKLLEAQGIVRGDPATVEAMEHELVTLVHLKSRELLIENLNLGLNHRVTLEPNENTPLELIVPQDPAAVLAAMGVAAMPVNPTRAQRAAIARLDADRAAAVTARTQQIQQLQALGFDPNNPPTLGEIANRLTDPSFNLNSAQGRQFMSNLNISDGSKETLKNLIETTKNTQQDVHARKNWADTFNSDLDGAKGADLRKASTEYKQLLERKETLSHVTIDSSVDALLAAGSAAQAVITAPPGKLNTDVISNRVGNTLRAGARADEDPADVTQRADKTKSMITPTLDIVTEHLKVTKSRNSVLAATVSRRVNHNLLDEKKASDNVTGNLGIDAETKVLANKVVNHYQSELESKDIKARQNARIECATLISLGAAVYAVARNENIPDDKAKALAERLVEYSSADLTDIRTVLETEAKRIGGIPATKLPELTAAARTSLSISKGITSAAYEPRKQAKDKFYQVAKKHYPTQIALKLSQKVDESYDKKQNDLKACDAKINEAIDTANKEATFIYDQVEASCLTFTTPVKQRFTEGLQEKFFENGALDKETIKQCAKSAGQNLTAAEEKKLTENLIDDKGKLKVLNGQVAQRFCNLTVALRDTLRQSAEEIYTKIPENQIITSVSASAQSAGIPADKANIAGKRAAQMKLHEQKDEKDIAVELTNILPSTDPVVGASVISMLDFDTDAELSTSIENNFAESTQNGRQAAVALAITAAAKSTILADPDYQDDDGEEIAEEIATDLISSEDSGYHAKEVDFEIYDCIEERHNDLDNNLKEELRLNVRAAYAVAIGKIAGQEAVKAHGGEATINAPNSNVKNMREVAAVSAATVLSEKLPEDLSLEIGAQMAKHYADDKGVLDEKKMDALMEKAFEKYDFEFETDEGKQATKAAIQLSTKAAAGLTQRGKAHGGTTAATAAVPVLPQDREERIRYKAKALAITQLCASGDNPDQNTEEIGEALAVTSSGFKASEQQAKSTGSITAASTSICHTIFTGFDGAHGDWVNAAGNHQQYAQYTVQGLGQVPGLIIPNGNPHEEIRNNIITTLTEAKSDLNNAQKDVIAETTDESIQTAASKAGADPNSIAIAGSIAASTTTAALEAKVSNENAKLLGQSFAEINDSNLNHRPENLAMVMESSYMAAKTEKLSALADRELKNTLIISQQGKIADSITAAQTFVDSKLGVPPPANVGAFPNELKDAVDRFNADKSRQSLANLNHLASSIIEGAATKVEKTLSNITVPLKSEALVEIKKSEAATAAALRIAKTPGLPPSTLKIVFERANYYADRARRAAEDNTTLKPQLTPEVDRDEVRKLAKTAGVSGYALAKGIIKGKELARPIGITDQAYASLQAQASVEESAKISGAKDADAKAAGLEAKLSIEQKLTPREVGGLTGLKLNQANRPDVAKPTAATAAYFAPNPGGALKTNQSIAQDTSQTVGATAAYERRVLADSAGLEDYDSPNGVRRKVGQNYTADQVSAGAKKVQDKTHEFAKKEPKAPTPTGMANDPVYDVVIDVNKLGESTIKFWDEKEKRLVDCRIDERPEFQAEMAALRTCVNSEGESLLTLDVIREAAKEFNKNNPKATPIDINQIHNKTEHGKHHIPLKNLSVDQIKQFFQLVEKKAKQNMSPEMKNISGPGLRRK